MIFLHHRLRGGMDDDNLLPNDIFFCKGLQQKQPQIGLNDDQPIHCGAVMAPSALHCPVSNGKCIIYCADVTVWLGAVWLCAMCRPQLRLSHCVTHADEYGLEEGGLLSLFYQ